MPVDLGGLRQSTFIDFHPLLDKKLAAYTGDTLVYLATIEKDQLVVTASIPVDGEFLSIAQDKTNGDLYLGSSQGLHLAKQTFSSRWSLDSTLLNNISVKKIVFDNSNKLWVATDFGLGFLDKLSWSWITREHGLLDDQLTAEGLVVMDNGQLLVSTKFGISTIEKRFCNAFAKSRIILDQLWVDGVPRLLKSTLQDDHLEVERHAQNLQFQFSTVGNYDDEPARVSYQVSSQENGWRVLGEDRMLRLEPLPVGKHMLLIQARVADGSVTEAFEIPIQYLFRIGRPCGSGFSFS